MNKYHTYAKVVEADERVNQWIDKSLASYLAKNPEVQDDIEHIIDYLSSEEAPKRIEHMSYDEAKSNAEKWSKAQQKKGALIKETLEDTTVVLDFKAGLVDGKNIKEDTWYKLEAGEFVEVCPATP